MVSEFGTFVFGLHVPGLLIFVLVESSDPFVLILVLIGPGRKREFLG